jgi:UDP-N-acetylglucosamine:LPS N-acetylglucosamine transferase
VGDKKIVFLGLGMKIGVDSLGQLPIWDSPNYVFLVYSNVQVNYKNVYQIPADYLESQNYIAAFDLVISKAGWGMIGEALSANVPLLILNRPSMQEDQNTIEYLMSRRLCELIDWEEFKSYQPDEVFIERLEPEVNANNLVHSNQAERIDDDLLKLL